MVLKRYRYFKHVLRHYFYLMSQPAKKKLWAIFLGLVLLTMLETVGIGLIVPFISMLLGPKGGNHSQFFMVLSVFFPHIPKAWEMYLLGSIFVGVFILKNTFSFFLNAYINIFSYTESQQLRTRLFHFFLTMSYEHFLKKDRASRVQLAVEGTGLYAHSLMSLLRIFSEVFVLGILFVIVSVKYPQVLGLFMAMMLGPFFVFYFFTKGKVQKLGEMGYRAHQKLIKQVQEGLEGIKDIQLFGVNQKFFNHFDGHAKEHAKAEYLYHITSYLPRFFLELGLIFVVVIYCLVTMFVQKDTSVLLITLTLMGILGLRGLPSMMLIMNALSGVKRAMPYVEQLYQELQLHKGFTPLSEAKDVFSELKVDALCFHYGSSQDILKNLHFTIKAKEYVGIIGTSGSGKSTLVDILVGFLTPSAGQVLYNGVNLKVQDWRSYIAYISQTPFLLDGTIEENIALGQDQINTLQIEMALKKAQLWHFVQGLAKKEKTNIGDKGLYLSGGQRQRVAIARALYFDRPILIFDEATSALDLETERDLIREISALKGDRTLISVAHRHATLEKCDRILHLEEGRLIAEYRSVQEIPKAMAKKGHEPEQP